MGNHGNVTRWMTDMLLSCIVPQGCKVAIFFLYLRALENIPKIVVFQAFLLGAAQKHTLLPPSLDQTYHPEKQTNKKKKGKENNVKMDATYRNEFSPKLETLG